MNSDKNQIEKSFLVKWVFLTCLGWIIGMIASFIVAHILNIIYPKETNLVVGLCIGAVVGCSQWLILKKHITLSGKWVLACAIGMGIPFIVEVVLEESGVKLPDLLSGQTLNRTAVGIIGGLLSGLLQIPLLKPFTKKVNLWVIASCLGWACCWLVSSLGNMSTFLLSMLLSGLILGFITGVFILFILKSPVKSHVVAVGTFLLLVAGGFALKTNSAANQMPERTSILQPKDAKRVNRCVVIEVGFTQADSSKEMWVVVQPVDSAQYHPQPRPHMILRDRMRWNSVAFIGEPDEAPGRQYHLYLFSATEEAGKAFNDYITASLKINRWPGFNVLPAGLTPLDTVTVVRK